MEFEVEASAMKVSLVKAPFGVGLRPITRLSISVVAALLRIRRLITSGRVTETSDSLELVVEAEAEAIARAERMKRKEDAKRMLNLLKLIPLRIFLDISCNYLRRLCLL